MNANDRRAGAGRRVYAAGVARRPILTPDRRLRVFVSSTLRELAQERVAAREAISSLHLAPRILLPIWPGVNAAMQPRGSANYSLPISSWASTSAK